ncbi:MAG: 2,3-bisphosphoglycerate-independent phosphoglycerate mutase [bacterium]|nr:2,3-bisphosphoglycerate-independent phosphoglycerate mutase [bacterium]
METNKQIALIVLDGWGYREDPTHNAIAAAKTPTFTKLWNEYPNTLLDASGLAVGLPGGQMGNSEIGHTTIGAGKIIDTDLVRIGKAIDANDFVDNAAFNTLFNHVNTHDSTLHIKGLLGEGGVHAHSNHLFAFLKAAKERSIEKIALHIFTDGRDTPPQSAHQYLVHLEQVLEELGIGFIATASGRFYAMDRDNNWDRLKKTEDAIFEGKGTSVKGKKPSEIVKELYAEGKIDEHLEPIIFLDDNGKGYKVEKNDGVFFFNFRADRARMLSKKIVEKRDSHNICFVTLTEYDKTLGAHVAYPQTLIETTLAAEISRSGFTQAHIAETEKFPHATYFLNGGKELPHDGEEHIMLDSRKDVPTHDLAPKMRAEAIADKAIEHIEKGTNFIFINFANPDMVGHTAHVPAIIEAVEEVDTQLGRVVDALHKKGGISFVTADHGNAEVNIDPITGNKHTSHTINKVPAIVTKKDISLKSNRTLADITPTILKLFGIKQPDSMTGEDLIL